MKNKFNYPLSAALALFYSLSAYGQVDENKSYTNNGISNEDIQIVSARIASTYHAEPQTVTSYVQAAFNLERHIGIAAPVIIAIAIHESSFKSELFLNTGNPFGIKASKPWTGPTFLWRNGEEANFRVYGSAEEAVLDFGNFIKSRNWYADALACPIDDYRCVINGLEKTDSDLGYSMNPAWDEAVLSIIARLGLNTVAVR